MSHNVLIAVNGIDEDNKKMVMDQLNDLGADIESVTCAYTKMGVRQEYEKFNRTEDQKNAEPKRIDVILIGEFLEQSSPYTPEDYNELDELDRELRVIPVISDEHMGGEYVNKLYSYAIYDAIFDQDAAMEKVASQIFRGRVKKDARDYYRIKSKEELFRITSNPESIRSSLNHILKGGNMEDAADRAAYVMEHLSTGEFFGVIEKLPDEYYRVLKMDDRFSDFFRSDESKAAVRRIKDAADEKTEPLEENTGDQRLAEPQERIKTTGHGETAEDTDHTENVEHTETADHKNRKEYLDSDTEGRREEGPRSDHKTEHQEETQELQEIAGRRKRVRSETAEAYRKEKQQSTVKQVIPSEGQERELISVVGLTEMAGSTFVSLNLAGMLARNGRYTPTIVQFPQTNGHLYSELNFEEHFGNEFISHMQQLQRTDTVPTGRNEYCGVNFIVPDEKRDHLDQWSYKNSMRLLMKTQSPCIVDLGSSYLSGWQNEILMESTQIIAVIDAAEEPDIGAIREMKEYVKASDARRLMFVINAVSDDEETWEEEIEEIIGQRYPVVRIPLYAESEMKKSKNGFACNVVKDDSELCEMLQLLGFSMETGKKNLFFRGIKKKPRSEQERLVLIGTQEIGFLGTESGTGTTFSALMCCFSLSSEYKVAYLELNQSWHMCNFCNELTEAKASTVMFAYKGVDIYYGLSYMEFAAQYRERYDYVVIDFGPWSEDRKIPEFIRTGKKFIVGGCTPWRIGSVEKFALHMENFTQVSEMIYLFPFLAGAEEERQLKRYCGEYPMERIGYCGNVFTPDADIKKMFREYLTARDRGGTSIRRKFFWRK